MIKEIFERLIKTKLDDDFVFSPRYKKIIKDDTIINFTCGKDDDNIREDRHIDFCFKLKQHDISWYNNIAIDTWNINGNIHEYSSCYPSWWNMNDPTTWYIRDINDKILLLHRENNWKTV